MVKLELIRIPKRNSKQIPAFRLSEKEIGWLRDCLQKVEAGELTEFVIVGRMRDGSMWRAETRSNQVFEMGAALISAGMRRLGFQLE